MSPPNPAACLSVSGASFVINVDRNAVVNEPCIEIKPGVTELVWQGGERVKHLVLAFKPKASVPVDPECISTACVLDETKHAASEGDFSYTVVVVRTDGTTASVDPRLIIRP